MYVSQNSKILSLIFGRPSDVHSCSPLSTLPWLSFHSPHPVLHSKCQVAEAEAEAEEEAPVPPQHRSLQPAPVKHKGAHHLQECRTTSTSIVSANL